MKFFVVRLARVIVRIPLTLLLPRLARLAFFLGPLLPTTYEPFLVLAASGAENYLTCVRSPAVQGVPGLGGFDGNLIVDQQDMAKLLWDVTGLSATGRQKSESLYYIWKELDIFKIGLLILLDL